MFGLFRKSEESPVEETRRQWIDRSFAWMIHEFGDDVVKSKRVLKPSAEDFPIEFLASEENAFELLDIVAQQMDLDPDLIDIDFYQEGQSEIATGAGFYSRAFLKPAEHERTSSGCYRGKNEDGCYLIELNSRSMRNAESLVATIAHELAHIKLLGEERISKNNEPLTDLTTIIYGLGVFGANSAATFQTGAYSWSHGRQGYLSQMDWGYALALFARIRGEENPEWLKFLTLNVKEDFKQSIRFMRRNPAEVTKSAG